MTDANIAPEAIEQRVALGPLVAGRRELDGY